MSQYSHHRPNNNSFWKPGTIAPGSNIEREPTSSDIPNHHFVFNPSSYMSLSTQRKRLPIYKSRDQILYAIEKYSITIIVAETGSGKTTQIPQYLFEAGWTSGNRMIGITQPRRVAVTSVSKRVSEEMNTQLGNKVGYIIRYYKCYDEEKTKIKYLTDGCLLRETMLDPLLTSYSVIIIDEAHERSVSTDLLLGLLKKIMKKRKDLRLVISSATISASDFMNFFDQKDHTVILGIEGKIYPVDVFYLKEPISNYVNQIISTVLDIHVNESMGDILVFLTGEDEIKVVCKELNESSSSISGKYGMKVFPLYANLEAREQLKCFKRVPPNYRKVIISTNIAESSLTIPGIVYIVDSLFVKIRAFDPLTLMESLLITPISQASADQRKGRAGRIRPGKCYRLCTEDDYSKLLEQTVPEMQRCNIVSIILHLKALGVDNLTNFEFLSPPPAESVIRALELLFSLNALNISCKLTSPIGTFLSEVPIEPRFARMLIASGEMGCSEEILSIASMLSVPTVFMNPRGFPEKAERAKMKFAVHEGDHLTLLNVYNSFLNNNNPNWCYEHYLNYRSLKQAIKVRNQLKKYLLKYKIKTMTSGGNFDIIRRCIVVGFFSNAASLQSDGSYKTVRGNEKLFLHPNSILYKSSPEWIIFHDVVLTKMKYMRDVTVIEPMWLTELAPQFYELKNDWDK